MNSETAIVVAVVLTITIVLGVALFFTGGLDEVGTSLFGDNSAEDGFFQPDEGVDEFPSRDSDTTSSSHSEVISIDKL